MRYEQFLEQYENHNSPRARRLAQSFKDQTTPFLTDLYAHFETMTKKIMDERPQYKTSIMYAYMKAREVAKVLGSDQQLKGLHKEVLPIVGEPLLL